MKDPIGLYLANLALLAGGATLIGMHMHDWHFGCAVFFLAYGMKS